MTKSTIAKVVLSKGSCTRSRRYNSLYCMNRTSLRTRSMLIGTVYIHEEAEAARRQEKAMEDDRSY